MEQSLRGPRHPMRTRDCAGALDLCVLEGTPMMAAPIKAAAATSASRAVLNVTPHLQGFGAVQGLCRRPRMDTSYHDRTERSLNVAFIRHSGLAGRPSASVQGARSPATFGAPLAYIGGICPRSGHAGAQAPLIPCIAREHGADARGHRGGARATARLARRDRLRLQPHALQYPGLQAV